MPPDDPGSIRAVAASLLVDRAPTAPTPERQGLEGTDQDATPPEGEDDEDQGLEQPQGGDEGLQGTDDPGDGGDDEPYYTVKVAGEVRDVSLSDLIKSYTGEGAIAKRLQEATEARNELVRARDVALEQERAAAKDVIRQETETLRTQAKQLAAVYQHYGAALMQPQVQMPDPSMQRSDPLGYLTGMEAYRQDQERVNAQQAHMQEVVQQAERMETQARAEYSRAEVERMVQEVPAMANPAYRKAQAERVFEIGRAVGFSDDEVRKYATDRRVIYLAMLAAQGAETIMKTRTGGKPTVTPKALPPRQQTSSPRASNGTFQKKAEAVSERARSTGDYRDVAKTLIVSKPRRSPGL